MARPCSRPASEQAYGRGGQRKEHRAKRGNRYLCMLFLQAARVVLRATTKSPADLIDREAATAWGHGHRNPCRG
jgi:hypothetical protein